MVSIAGFSLNAMIDILRTVKESREKGTDR